LLSQEPEMRARQPKENESPKQGTTAAAALQSASKDGVYLALETVVTGQGG